MTVVFADVVGFTELSSLPPPEEVVRMLNEMSPRFDHLAAGLKIEKIKMIGDACMAVGGVPVALEDHAGASAELALRMQEEVECINEERGANVRLRIGLNTGPGWRETRQRRAQGVGTRGCARAGVPRR